MGKHSLKNEKRLNPLCGAKNWHCSAAFLKLCSNEFMGANQFMQAS
jgi:hypothetical protein